MDAIQLRILLALCLFLLYHNQKHPMVAAKISWDELLKLAAAEILNLDISPLVLQRFGLPERAYEDLEERPKTWVELAVLQVVGEQDLVAERLVPALAFHRSVSDHAAAHLNLLLDNTFRTPWMAAKLLSTNEDLARDVPSEAPCDNQARKQNLL